MLDVKICANHHFCHPHSLPPDVRRLWGNPPLWTKQNDWYHHHRHADWPIEHTAASHGLTVDQSGTCWSEGRGCLTLMDDTHWHSEPHTHRLFSGSVIHMYAHTHTHRMLNASVLSAVASKSEQVVSETPEFILLMRSLIYNISHFMALSRMLTIFVFVFMNSFNFMAYPIMFRIIWKDCGRLKGFQLHSIRDGPDTTLLCCYSHMYYLYHKG